MKLLKRAGLGLTGLVLVLIAAAYALPRHVEVERSVVIAAEPDEIFPYLNSLEKFNDWSPWAELDPKTVYVFSGPASGVGARSTWTSDHAQVGNGYQEITVSEPHTLIRAHLDFGADGGAEGFYTLDRVDTGTRVVWGIEFDVGNNPIGRYMGFVMVKAGGGDFDKGLARLKSLTEKGEV